MRLSNLPKTLGPLNDESDWNSHVSVSVVQAPVLHSVKALERGRSGGLSLASLFLLLTV